LARLDFGAARRYLSLYVIRVQSGLAGGQGLKFAKQSQFADAAKKIIIFQIVR
jgi:hypothetical protein